MATNVLGLKTFAASDPVDYNEINDNYNKIDSGVKTALQGRAAYNLLDNSNFRNPVNQRGQTSYSGGEYAIDRWKNQAGTNMALMDGFIRITGDWDIRQILGKKLIGTYTFAACAKVNVAGEYTQTIEVFENDSPIASSMCTGVGEWKIYICTATFTGANNITNPMVVINNRAGSISDASMDVQWAALYEGSYTADTLPAYQPKGYAEELAECQRYFWRCNNTWFAEGSGYAFSNTEYRVSIILPQMMRVTPTMISSTGNTTSYGIKIHTGSGANLTPTAVSLSMKNNRIALTLTGNFTNGELGVLRLENDYLDFSADL